MTYTNFCQRISIVVAVFLVIFLSCALPPQADADEDGPSILPDKDWWVMIGPRPEQEKDDLQKTMERINELFPGLQPELSSTSDFFWLPKKEWAVLIGPEKSKKKAKDVLWNLKRVFKEAKLVQTARRSPRPMPWFTGRWLVTWPNGNLNGMKLTVSRDSYLITGTVQSDRDSSCGVTGKCSSVDKARMSVICPTSGLSFDMDITLEDMNNGTGKFYLKGDKGQLTISRN